MMRVEPVLLVAQLRCSRPPLWTPRASASSTRNYALKCSEPLGSSVCPSAPLV